MKTRPGPSGRKLLTAFLGTALLALVCTGSLYAHPGRLDENGGHYVRSGPNAGTYHYHTGEHSSSSDSSSSGYQYHPETTYTPKEYRPTARPEAKPFDFLSYDLRPLLIPAGVVAGMWLLCVASTFFQIMLDRFRTHSPTFKLDRFKSSLSDLQAKWKETEDLASSIADFHFTPIPPGFQIGPDHLPKEADAKGWGDTFTVYRTPNGRKIHKKYGCSFARHRQHICRYRNVPQQENMLCRLCFPKQDLPDLKWYDKWRDEQLTYRTLTDRHAAAVERLHEARTYAAKWYEDCNTRRSRLFMRIFRKKDRLNELNGTYRQLESRFDGTE